MTESTQLMDDAALAAFLDDHFGDRVGIRVERHKAGHSNETFFVDRGDARYVLRRPPAGAFLPSAHDVGREFTVLSALEGTVARSPRTILRCEDDSIIGAPFYLMERIDGVVIRADLRKFLPQDDRWKVGEELVDALVELHSVDPASVGLADFGKPTGYLERQLRRWNGQLELTLPFTRPLPDLEKVGEWLRDNIPSSPPSTLVHGDYKLDNVMFAPEGPARLNAILDWEMSTIGDPLADLGWMISFWSESDDPGGDMFADLTNVTVQPGFSRRKDLIARYEERSGTDVRALDWYRIMATWKLAILLEGSYARHLAGATDDPFFARMEEGVPALARRGLALMTGA
ncbi:MAG: phosphotransferase family protein [Actinomycetota bacterium]